MRFRLFRCFLYRSTYAFLIFALFFTGNKAKSQIGGKDSFEFLNIPTNARVAAEGGVNNTLSGKDPNMFLSNPALLHDSLSHLLSLNYLNYYAGINYSSLAYTNNFKKYGTFGLGVIYLNYGEFNKTDDAGTDEGTFTASDYAVCLGYSHTRGYFTLGTNLKFAFSGIDAYRASAILVDIGGIFRHPTEDLTVGLTIKNAGILVSDYSENSNSTLPFDIQTGISFKPEHMPFRFSATLYHLDKGDITYYDEKFSDSDKSPGFGDRLLRHAAFGAEFLLSKNFHIRGGYNHLIRKELRLEQTAGSAGFSFGFMFKIKKFEFAYSNSRYHVVGGAHFFTVGGDLEKLL